MLRLVLWRRLATTTADEFRLLPPAAKVASCRSVFDSSQAQITSALRQKYDTFHVANTESRIRLSQYLQAVFLGDTTTALSLLRRYKESCTSSSIALDRNIQIYTSCLTALLIQLIHSDRSISVSALQDLVKIVQSSPNVVNQRVPDTVREVHTLLLLVFLKTIETTPKTNRISYMNLIAFTKSLLYKFKLKPDDILPTLHSTRPASIPSFNRVFNRNEPEVVYDTKTEHMLVETLASLKRNGKSLSYDGLCSFIEECPFDASSFSKDKDAKFYEIAACLPAEEKAKFMTEYLKFNWRKQLLIEEHSQNVYKEQSQFSTLHSFSSVHKKSIQTWTDDATEQLIKIIDTDKTFLKFGFIFAQMRPRSLVSFCLAHMLSATVLKEHTKVFSLANSMIMALRGELRQRRTYNITEASLKLLFNQEQALEFACALIKLLVENCQHELQPGEKLEQNVNELSEPWGTSVFKCLRVRDFESGPKKWTYGVVQIRPSIARQFQIYSELFEVGSYRLPMIHPPQRWTSPQDGGFLSIPMSLVNSSEQEITNAYVDKANKTGQLNSIYNSLNTLASTPWTINPFMIDIFNSKMIEFDSCSPRSGLPMGLFYSPMQNKKPKPQESDFSSDNDFKEAYRDWKRSSELHLKQVRDAENLKVYYMMVNKLANSLAKHGEIMYFPHHMDFRGRVYPSVSFLSHHNEDLIRSLLMFWEAKPLGSNGFQWLKYQLANLYCKSKLTMEQSIAFVEANKESIVHSAKEPLADNSWWLEAENPWQALSVCKELSSIWEFKGDISTYLSRIPVHQDGSCNGLQHYAALGADKEAARSVNVLPDTNRQDVYNTVLKLVKNNIENETCVSQDTWCKTTAAQLLSRKLIKQTVMTTVYGVTGFGATRQVKKKIDDVIQEELGLSLTESERYKVASYIAKHVLSSISELFAGAKLIQNWLVENCNRCIKAFDAKEYPNQSHIDFFSGKHYRPMMWTSLSGFPVIQMYRKRIVKDVVTPLQIVTIRDNKSLAQVDANKSRNGIAPNFIHSLDAIHLMMTSLAAMEKDITFAAVHDCFWTHACEVDTLSKDIREEFARLHKSQIIENLRQDLIYLNRKSYQLVWVDIELNNQFARDINELRSSYPHGNGKLSKTEMYNSWLSRELQDNSQVDTLVNKHNPTLVWKSLSTRQATIYDKSSELRGINKKISTKTHIPVLTPVQILEAPSVGSLEIETVKESTFFFS